MKLIHIAPDEKFIDSVITQFNDLDNIECIYCILSDSNTLTFIKNKDVKIFNNIENLVNYVNGENCDYVILHSFYFTNTKSLYNIKHKIIACSMGYDIITYAKDIIKKPINLNLYKPLTYNLDIISRKSFKLKLNYFKHYFYATILHGANKNYNALLNKFQYMSTIIPAEFKLVQEQFPKLKYFPFKYIVKSDNQIQFNYNTNTSNNVLVGNSRNPWNNQLDILNLLETRKISCNAYIPISYPIFDDERDSYVDVLKNFSKNTKYVNCIFLEEYLDRSEYFKILNNCSVFIMGCINQNAIGNIFQGLRLGKKIFLYNDSMLSDYFNENNVTIFDIERDLNNTIFSNVLSKEQQKQNFDFVMAEENYTKYIQNLQKFFDNIGK